MAARWRIFLKPIPSHPKNVKNLVLAGVVLHNFLTVADPKYADEGYGDRYRNGTLSAGQWRQDISERERSTCCFRELVQNWSKLPKFSETCTRLPSKVFQQGG